MILEFHGLIIRRMDHQHLGFRAHKRPYRVKAHIFGILRLFLPINPLIKNTTGGLEVKSRGGIIVNENGLTSKVGVYAGGDAVTGAATVISAMGAGKIGAKAIDEYLGGGK